MAKADALKEMGWRLNPAAITELAGPNATPQEIAKKALDADLRQIADKSMLTQILGSEKSNGMKAITVPVIVQIQKIMNIAVPKDQSEVNTKANNKSRLLYFVITDGLSSLTATEVQPIRELNLDTPPGTKLRIAPGASVYKGIVQLLPGNVEVLYGRVPKLISAWEQTRQAENSRAVHIPRRGVGEGPPMFTPFGQAINARSTDNVDNGAPPFRAYEYLKNKTSAEKAGDNQTGSDDQSGSEFSEQRQAAIAKVNNQRAADKGLPISDLSRLTIAAAAQAKLAAADGHAPAAAAVANAAAAAPAQEGRGGAAASERSERPERPGRGGGRGGRGRRGGRGGGDDDDYPASRPSAFRLFDLIQQQTGNEKLKSVVAESVLLATTAQSEEGASSTSSGYRQDRPGESSRRPRGGYRGAGGSRQFDRRPAAPASGGGGGGGYGGGRQQQQHSGQSYYNRSGGASSAGPRGPASAGNGSSSTTPQTMTANSTAPSVAVNVPVAASPTSSVEGTGYNAWPIVSPSGGHDLPPRLKRHQQQSISKVLPDDGLDEDTDDGPGTTSSSSQPQVAPRPASSAAAQPHHQQNQQQMSQQSSSSASYSQGGGPSQQQQQQFTDRSNRPYQNNNNRRGYSMGGGNAMQNQVPPQLQMQQGYQGGQHAPLMPPQALPPALLDPSLFPPPHQQMLQHYQAPPGSAFLPTPPSTQPGPPPGFNASAHMAAQQRQSLPPQQQPQVSGGPPATTASTTPATTTADQPPVSTQMQMPQRAAPQYPYAVGQFCFSQWADNQYYPAQVLNIDYAAQTAHVLYFQYNDYQVVPLSNLRPIMNSPAPVPMPNPANAAIAALIQQQMFAAAMAQQSGQQQQQQPPGFQIPPPPPPITAPPSLAPTSVASGGPPPLGHFVPSPAVAQPQQQPPNVQPNVAQSAQQRGGGNNRGNGGGGGGGGGNGGGGGGQPGGQPQQQQNAQTGQRQSPRMPQVPPYPFGSSAGGVGPRHGATPNKPAATNSNRSSVEETAQQPSSLPLPATTPEDAAAATT